MRVSHRYLIILLLLSIGLWCVFSREALRINSALMSGREIDHPASRYDRALDGAMSGRYREAYALLDGLTYHGYDDRIYELSGDILLSESGQISDVLRLYHLSLDLSDTPRIREKISLLEHALIESTSGSLIQERASTTDSGSAHLSHTGVLQSAIDAVESLQSQKSLYLAPQSLSPTDQLRDIREFLDIGAERIDW